MRYEKKLMKILGISAFYHDSAAAVVVGGVIVAAAQEERFSRVKHDPSFPVQAIRYCLEEAGLALDELDAVVFYDKPLLKFERLLETYYGFAPRGLASFVTSIPVWIKEKLFLKKMIRDELEKVGEYNRKKMRLLFPEHHLSHAASAFYPSSFTDAAILTIDGVGEWATASICHGKGKDITVLKELHFPHSVGLLYSAVTYFLGFKVNSGEYKVMGLAPYGSRDSAQVKDFVRKIKNVLVDVKQDGSIALDQKYFTYATGLRMLPDRRWAKLFGFSRRQAEAEITQQHCDLAAAIQQVTEEIVLKMAQEAKRLTGSDNLCMAGGVALNCVANGKIQEQKIFENYFVQPAAGDAGGALGAALAAQYIYFEKERTIDTAQADAMQGAALGPEASDRSIEYMAKRYAAVFSKFSSFDELTSLVARHLSDGKVVGWQQGRMEFGPRALGNRSILADPRNPEMQRKLNLSIKYRESFRPFAPSVLAEDVAEYFDFTGASPYMMFVHSLKKSRCFPTDDSGQAFDIKAKLQQQRSDLPAITHVDGTARIQTVHKESNEKFWLLLQAFKQKTGCSVLVNTSFNVRGEPLVCSAEDAYRCLMRTEMDFLVIGNYIFDKGQQPLGKEAMEWKNEYILD